MEPNKALIKDAEAEDVDVHLYRSMIGSLMYLTSFRPDIIFVVRACAKFQVTLKTTHLHDVKGIFRYLKGQPKLGFWYPRDSPFDLDAYSDIDYARASLDRKSTTKGCQFLGKRLILWQCKKQTIVANSTTEEEYVAAASCCGHVLWIQNQMLDYGLNLMNTKIYIDNESIICIVKTPPKRKQKQATEVHSPSSEIPIEENIPTTSNDPLPSGEDSIQLNKLMIFCTNLQQQGRSIKDIDQDAKIALVDEAQGRMHDVDIFGVDDLKGNEVIIDVIEKIVKKEVSTTDLVTVAGEVVTTASVEDSVAPTTVTTANVDDELTLAKTLITIKAAKPKVISIAATIVTTAITTSRAKVNAANVQLVLLVYKVTAVFNKVNPAKSRVTTAIRVSTAGRIKWLEEQDMRVNEIY
nr:uncharacterized mitochondrial protein AtMg00810-like [Tanacetum cinerariifolium]